MVESIKEPSKPALNPVARDFIRYCIECQDQELFALYDMYDTMCWVAGRHLFRDMGYEGLREVGLSLGLGGIEDTYKMVDAVIAEIQKPRGS